MPTCEECSQTFDVAEARSEYEAEFNGDLSYDEYGAGLCGPCAINNSQSHINHGSAILMMNGDEDYDADHVEKYL